MAQTDWLETLLTNVSLNPPATASADIYDNEVEPKLNQGLLGEERNLIEPLIPIRTNSVASNLKNGAVERLNGKTDPIAQNFVSFKNANVKTATTNSDDSSYYASGARPKAAFWKSSKPGSSPSSLIRHVTPPKSSSVVRSQQPYTPSECELVKVNPLNRAVTRSDAPATKYSFWSCPISLKLKRQMMQVVDSDDAPPLFEDSKYGSNISIDNNQVSVVNIKAVATENSPPAVNNADDLPVPSTLSEISNYLNAESAANFDEIWRCTKCGEIASPHHLNTFGMCKICLTNCKTDLDDDAQNFGFQEDHLESLSLCIYCGCAFQSNLIGKHENRCQDSSFNKSNRSRHSTPNNAPHKYKRCKFCRSPLDDDYAAEHERDCHMNPLVKQHRDNMREQDLADAIQQFRQTPNPTPHNWTRSVRDNVSGYGEQFFVGGIGMDFVNIPCEFCGEIIQAKNLYNHQRQCEENASSG